MRQALGRSQTDYAEWHRDNFRCGGCGPATGGPLGGGINTVLAQQSFASLNKATVKMPQAVRNGNSLGIQLNMVIIRSWFLRRQLYGYILVINQPLSQDFGQSSPLADPSF